MLKADNLTKTFSLDGISVPVLENICLNVIAGEFVVISGSSGSGKTTLLTLLSGLDRPTGGRVWIGDADITDLGEDDLATLRNRDIGYVFQSFHLIPSLNAEENVMFPAELAGHPRTLNLDNFRRLWSFSVSPLRLYIHNKRVDGRRRAALPQILSPIVSTTFTVQSFHV